MTKTMMECVDTFIDEYKQDENIQDDIQSELKAGRVWK